MLTSTSAVEALEMFRRNHVDLVLAEEVTPVFTLAAIRVLKPEVPVAIYTAHWEAAAEHLRFAEGFITKLVSPDEFLCAIENLLAKSPTAAA